MKKVLLILFLFVQAQISFSKGFNEGTIKGTLKDEHNAAIPFVTVVLRNSSDSSFCKGELSNEAGEFIFEGIKTGNYFAEITAIGYQIESKNNISISSEVPLLDLGLIILHEDSKKLQAVDIRIDKPFIERLSDRTVVNIENSIIQTGSSVLEIMEKLPGVQVNDQGSVSLKGKQGVSVMIDGRLTVLSGQDLANFLKGMSSSTIQKVEIITNPSAKYDAEGNSGIINIITKKNKKEGLNGTVNGTYTQGRYGKGNAGINLSLKEKKYNLFMSYSYVYNYGFNHRKLIRSFMNNDSSSRDYLTNTYILFKVNSHNPQLGADFYVSKKTTVSILTTSLVSDMDNPSDNNTDIFDANKTKKSSYNFNNHSHENLYNYAFNTKLNHQFDSTGKEITTNLDYVYYTNSLQQKFVTTNKNAQGDFMNQKLETGDQGRNLQIYSVKADYTHPFKKQAKFEAGIKSSYVEADNDIKFYNNISDDLQLDLTRSNHFIYSENINAAYLNYKKEFKKLNFQFGLRSEQTISHGEQISTGKKFNQNYIKIFPSAFLDYKITDKHGINLSLGRRIDRPAYEQMNPFRRLVDVNNFTEGNPYLQPQFSYTSELSYSYDNIFFATLGYTLTTNNITQIFIQEGTGNNSIETFVNLNKLNYYSLDLVYSKRFTKWWTTNTNVLSYYGIYSGTIDNYTVHSEAPSLYINTNNSFSITNGLSAEAGFAYWSRYVWGVMEIKPGNNLSFGIKQSVFNKRGSITVNVTDLLWKSYSRGSTNFGNFYSAWSAQRDTRLINVSFSYRFGRSKALDIRTKTGADDEKRRTRS